MKVATHKWVSWGILLGLSLALVSPVFAYTTEPVQIDPNRQDFVVGPGKTDVILKPGEKKVLELMVSNRTGKDRQFEIKFANFAGSNDLSSPIVLSTESYQSTMKDFLSVPENIFFLKNGERARVPVTVSVPANAEPGGRYVSVLVSTLTPAEQTNKPEGSSQGGVPLITQTGTLIFVTIPGETKTEGSLIEFYTQAKKTFFSYSKDIAFDLVYQNTGKIHLNPYGTVSVKNVFGQEVRKIEIEPWYAMPEALRFREVRLVEDIAKEDMFMLGRYTAEAKIMRGYSDKYDVRNLAFWVIPWNLLLAVLVGLIFTLWVIKMGIKYVSAHFQRVPATYVPPASDNTNKPL